MKFDYYEHIAAELFGIQPKDIFVKTRKGEIKDARFFCMTYRYDFLHLSFRISGLRYGKDHASVIHARNTIHNWVETGDKIGQLYTEFLQKCAEQKKQLELNGFANKGEFIKRVESMGWYDYVNTVKEPLNELIELVFRNENEDNIREQIDMCEEKIGELKYLYNIENEPKL